jgi:hypothetical protein
LFYWVVLAGLWFKAAALFPNCKNIKTYLIKMRGRNTSHFHYFIS